MKVRTVVISTSDGKRSLQFSTADNDKFNWIPYEFFPDRDSGDWLVHFDKIVERSDSAMKGILLEQILIYK